MKANDTLLQLVSLAVILFLYLYKNPTTTLFDLILFISIIVGAILLISVNWVMDKTNQIGKNTKSIKTLEARLDLRKEMAVLSDKISKVEGWKEAIQSTIKKKKGQVDPRIIIVVFIIILIILYLSSQGNN